MHARRDCCRAVTLISTLISELRVAAPVRAQVGKEVYFIGCIDILCEYGLKKQLEHHYKAAKHGERVGAQNFSVVDPLQYSTRFQNFVAEALD